MRILKRLINQILDFRAFENGKLEANLVETNFASSLREWVGAFTGIARKKNIRLDIHIPDNEDFTMAVDLEKMERVVYNLMSNALKYTPENGTVSFSCNREEEKMTFSVRDTGPGIKPEDREKIFDRFFQVDKVHPKGSGIGLSLVKAFVELHGGEIALRSEAGSGSEFTVTIPVRHVERLENPVSGNITRDDIEKELGEIEYNATEFMENKPIILVIDDNEDIRALLNQMLGNEYNVMTASDGKEGLRLAVRYTPDLVVCDVMMPVMDGLECCRQLKQEVSTSHIPVLMLTACGMDEQRATAYDSGADGYVSKPFSTSVLRSRISSLIANRRLIKNLWGGDRKRDEGDLSKPVAVGETPRQAPRDVENEFYSRFLALVDKEMGNPDLNVDWLASEMGLGRSQFYRKIKAITNYSPVELLRNLRLKKARHLLSTTDRSISEIAYEVGFSTPAYFSKCYREAFGETPTDLRSRL